MQSRSLFVLLAMAVGAGAFMAPSIFSPQSCGLVDSAIVRTRASDIVVSGAVRGPECILPGLGEGMSTA